MPRRFRLRTIIALLVLATAVPLGLFAVGLIWSSWRDQQAAVHSRNIEQARAIAATVVDEIDRTITSLRLLALLEPIDTDRAHYVAIVRRALPLNPTWESVRVIDPALAVLADTSAAEGTPAPLLNPDWVDRVIVTRQPAVSGLRRDPGGRWYVSIGVPVIRGDTLKYIIGARIRASAFGDILRRQRVGQEGVITILDGSRTIIARTRNEETYIGAKPRQDFIERTLATPEGSFRTQLLEGEPAYSAWTRVGDTGWAVGLGLLATTVDGPVQRSLLALVAALLAILTMGVGVALLLSRGLVRVQRLAAKNARALAQGDPVPLRRSRIVEVDDMFSGLREAGAILQARMHERDRAQAEADAYKAARLEREQSARRAAEALNRSKDEFVATVSHELRTPLNALFGWVALLKTGTLDATAQKHALDVLERNTRAQARLIEDLLDMSRVIQGAVRLDMRPLDLGDVLEAAVDSLRPTAQARQITVAVRRQGRAAVSADASRMQQVLWNLLSNSLKFTPPGGQVDAVAEVEDRHSVVRISDNGEGITPEFLPHVFDRFRQETADVTREHPGLGLGLSLVRHLTELHGGTVTAESRGKGQGATFTLRLPLLAARPEPAVAAGDVQLPPHEARVLQGMHVLAVDDEEDSRDLVATALRQAGARVTTAASSAEALAILGEHVVDLVVSDVAMPGGSGYELVRAIRASSRGGALPVVAVTAYNRREDREAAVAAGFDAHVGKPFEPRALVGLLAALVRPQMPTGNPSLPH